jgi:hypothetical protein
MDQAKLQEANTIPLLNPSRRRMLSMPEKAGDAGVKLGVDSAQS